jgi:hypothetical protein
MLCKVLILPADPYALTSVNLARTMGTLRPVVVVAEDVEALVTAAEVDEEALGGAVAAEAALETEVDEAVDEVALVIVAEVAEEVRVEDSVISLARRPPSEAAQQLTSCPDASGGNDDHGSTFNHQPFPTPVEDFVCQHLAAAAG